MSKPIKNLIQKTYEQLFADMDGAVLIDLRGVDSGANTQLRGTLAEKEIRVTVVKNTLARRAFEGTVMERLGELLEGPNAIVYGGESVVHVARELIQQVKGMPDVQFKGALMEGQLFGPDEIEALSKYPTREEALADVVQIILSPAGSLLGAVTGAGGQVAALIEAIEKKLDEGEAIQKVA